MKHGTDSIKKRFRDSRNQKRHLLRGLPFNTILCTMHDTTNTDTEERKSWLCIQDQPTEIKRSITERLLTVPLHIDLGDTGYCHESTNYSKTFKTCYE